MAAFALSAMFAACTKEEVPVVQEFQQDQFVGAELIGTDVSMNIGTDTKVDASGNFENGDKTGLGWMIYDNGTKGYKTPQLATKAANTSELFANHMYIRENGKFVSKGNMYKGWHFAYFPFQYMEMLGEDLKVTINPTQTEDYTRDVVNTVFNISGAHFLSAESLDENYQMKDEIVFDLVRAVNTILVTVKPTDMFTGSEALKNLKIKSIKLETKAKVFPSEVVAIDPTALPNIDGEEFTVADVYSALPNVMGTTRNNTNITTLVDNENFNLTADQTLRIYTLPTAEKTVSAKNVVFTIEVEGGVFTVPYVTDEEDPRYSETNIEAIEALVEAYEEDGKLTEFGTKALQLELELNGAMFAPAFGAISSESEWNNAIAVADALELECPVFTLVNEVDEDGNYEWVFTGDIKLLSDPESVLTVQGDPMVLGAEMEWPSEEYLNVETKVVVNADLRVDGDMNAGTIINNAVITVGPNGSVSNSEDKALVNNKEVQVEFGGYVFPSATAGTIAYVVEGATTADVYKVNTMLTHENTSVNTLIVRTELDLNAPAVIATEDGRYTEGDTADFLNDLSTKSVILEGGSLVHKLAGDNTTVKHLVARTGENTIDDVIVTTHIETEEGATLNVVNTVLPDYVKSYFSEEIVNEGTLKLDNVCLNVTEIDNTTGTIIATGKNHIYYSEADGYAQGGSVTGSVNYGVCKNMVVNTTAGLLEAINKAQDDATIKLANNMTLSSTLTIKKVLTIDLNGKTLKGAIIADKGANLTVENGTINNAVNDSDYKRSGIETKKDAALTLNNVNIKSARHAVRIESIGKVVINGGEYTVATKGEAHSSQFAINIGTASITADVTIKGGKFVGPKALKNVTNGAPVQVQGKSTLAIEGGEFSGAKVFNAIHMDGTPTITVTGGKYQGYNPTEYVGGTSYKITSVKEADGTWYVVSEK